MRALFRACEARGVRYLLIGGQASVLYGAAFFTQDLDLWIQPTRRNVLSLLAALGRLKARVHKLTPPITVANLLRGHGFHFRIPQRGAADAYVDVMGQPPRAGKFADASCRAARLETPWGRLPVVAIEDLVEQKKTNRPGDYEVITRLALIRLSRDRRPAPAVLRWALENVFQVEELWAVIEKFGPLLRPASLNASPAAQILHRAWSGRRPPGQSELSRAARKLAQEVGRLQEKGRAYWLPRLAELRRLRAAGLLLPEGTPVGSELSPRG